MKEKTFLTLWLSQTISQLGSSMSSFALVLWLYEKNSSVLSLSLITFFYYLAYILASIFSGAVVDRHNKKIIMMLSDSISAICTLILVFSFFYGKLSILIIYITNIIIGFMNAFQQPASSVVIGQIVPKDKIALASGLNSFSQSLIMILSPTFATLLYSYFGLNMVFYFDILTFSIAITILIFFIKLPKLKVEKKQNKIIEDVKIGFQFLKSKKGLLYLMIFMLLINFFSRLTYENILSPMILARSDNNKIALSLCNAFIGIGGLLGGLLISILKIKNNTKIIFISTCLSFLFGDFLMAIGRNSVMWSIAGFCASFPIPLICGLQNVLMYKNIPEELQGRVFAVKNAIQYSTLPIGILLGGILADCVFEPLMQGNSSFVNALKFIVGNTKGSGMAVMFLCTSVLGFAISLIGYFNKEIKKLN